MNEAGLQRLVRRMINRVGDGAWVEKGEMGRIYVSLGLWRMGSCRSTMEEERNSEWRWREKVRRETDE